MSLSMGDATNSGIYLTHLIGEIVKTTTIVSLHLLKLRYDGLQGHISCRRRRSRSGRSRRIGRNNKSCSIIRLHTWLFQSKLGLALPNKTSVDGTHGGEVRRIQNRNGEVLEDTRDSRRKDELITCNRILIHIKDRCDEMRREVNREVFKKRQKKTSTRLSDRVIVRQWSNSKCHHHINEPRAFAKA